VNAASKRGSTGRAVLLSDAAHAMLPHPGQGANTAIEDAITLAELAGANGADLDVALDEYELLRRARTREIQRASWMANRSARVDTGIGTPVPKETRVPHLSAAERRPQHVASDAVRDQP
jgi:2-polyprenyl-6-methoxyphenol hydroxylase-like FAD-dependent oxidoreductase